jgi:tetratricopeptide (TPR) repeat protein
LAAYLVAAPALERKLSTRRHAPGEPESPEGVAIVYAAVDWARCGRTDPLATETLRDLWPSYLPAGVSATDVNFEAGLDWALRPVAGTIALLQQTASYRAYEYIVRFVGDERGAWPPRDETWAKAAKGATDAQAFAVGTNAYLYGRYDDARIAFTSARQSSASEVAAAGGFNLAVTLGRLELPERALVVFDDVIARFGDANEPALREQVARALVSKGVTLGQLERSEEALVVFDDVIARFGDANEPALRERVARALFSKGVALGQTGRSEEALVVYNDVIARFGDANEPTLREQVANALVNKGVTLGRLGRSEEALVVFDDVIARFGDADEPALREAVLRASRAREQQDDT